MRTILCLALASSILSGCQKQESSDASASAKEETVEDQTITRPPPTGTPTTTPTTPPPGIDVNCIAGVGKAECSINVPKEMTIIAKNDFIFTEAKGGPSINLVIEAFPSSGGVVSKNGISCLSQKRDWIDNYAKWSEACMVALKPGNYVFRSTYDVLQGAGIKAGNFTMELGWK